MSSDSQIQPPPDPADVAVERALHAVRQGKIVVVVEDVSDGGSVFAALPGQYATAAVVNELATHARGIVGATMTFARADALHCQALERKRAPASLPRYGISIEAARGTSTGISAADRSLTVQLAADPAATAADFVRPGHIMPILVPIRGCLERAYGPEAAHDLTLLAGLQPCAAVSHVLDGLDPLLPENAERFCEVRGWPMVRVSQVVAYRTHHERLVHVVSEGPVETQQGPFQIRIYESDIDGESHIALLRDSPERAVGSVPLVRLHSQCLTGDILHSRRCDCGAQLAESMERIAKYGHGAIVYLRQEGRGIGLVQKIRAYALQDQGSDTVDANLQLGFAPDERDYAVAAQILRDLDMTEIALLTNNPHKITALRQLGIQIVRREPIVVQPTADNIRYLQTKRDRMGHWLDPAQG